jgi:hypothetical protein
MWPSPSPAPDANALPAPRASRQTRAGMPDLWALGDRRRLRPARVLRGRGISPGPGRGRLLGSDPSAQGSRLNGCASACRRRSATRAGRSRTSAATSMPAASIVLRSTSSSSLWSNPDPDKSVSMSLLMQPSVPRRCAARARFRHSRHRRRRQARVPRANLRHDARRPHRAPPSSSARCSPPRTPPPRTRSAWARRAGGPDQRRLSLVSGAG